MKQSLKAIALAAAILTAKALPVHAQEAEPPMDMDRMGEILRALDPDTTAFPSGFELTLADVPIMVVADPVADRMRAMIPIRSVAGMSGAELGRVLQANFDTALDARYAVANGRLWAVFIHPLSPLEQDQLISGIGQTVNIALSYGDTYSGGAVVFGGGDTARAQRALIDELLRRGQEL